MQDDNSPQGVKSIIYNRPWGVKSNIVFVLLGVMLLGACSSTTTYSRQLNQEKKTIENFISRNHLKIVTELPTDSVWADSVYYKVSGYDYLYYHLDKQGDTLGKDPVEATETVVIRYKKFTLTENPDTITYWSPLDSAYPIEFMYLTDYTNACTAWHIAVGLMMYSGSECTIICPSKQGFTVDQNTVTPYGYQLRMLIKR